MYFLWSQSQFTKKSNQKIDYFFNFFKDILFLFVVYYLYRL